MEAFSFTPDAVQNNVTPNDVSEFSFIPDEVQPDLTKVGAHNIFSLDGSNTNAAKKLNLVNRSWVEKFAQSDLGKFGDTQSKAVVRGLFDIAGGLGTMIRFYGDNMILQKGAFGLDDKTIDRINTFGRGWQKFGSSIKKGSDFVLNSKTLELDKDIFAGDIIDNPSVTRVSSAIMSAAPSLLGMVGIARATGSAGLAYFVMGGVDSADVYEKAKETGKTQETANLLYTSSQAGTALIDRMLSPLEKIMGNSPSTIWKKISQKIASGLSEGSAEGAQTVWQNAVKKYGIDDTQSLMDGVIEAAIGGFGSGALAAGTFNTAAERLKEKGATDRDIENISQAAIDYVQKHPDEINNIAFQQLNKGLDEFDKFVETHKGMPDAQKALQIKADLDEVYNKVFDQIKTSDIDKVAAAQAKVVQGVALWGSQELGISPLEYFEQRFPRIERVAYRDFARRLNEAKRTGEVAEINLYEALKNPSLLKGQKVKDTRQSLTQFLKQNGGLKDFGGELKANRMEVELAQVKKEVDDLADSKIENSVGNLLLEMAEQGKISHTQELRLKELLLARFSNQGLGNEFLRLLRDGGYIWTLGNFESAITQFGDLGTSAYKNGLWNTAFEYVKAWQGRSEITINDLGLEKIIQDGGYADTSAWSKALDKVLKYTGFEKMDKIAKQTLVNSAVRKARADAKAESPELEAYLRHEFGEKWVDVKEDLKTGAVTDEIMEYAMFQLLDVQPITIDQMPRYYTEGGKKRLFYMMKSYFIKQLNEYRKICFETAKSNPRKAVVDMTRLTVYLMLFNAGADVLKDLLFGRPVNVPDSLVDNIFIGGSINRYQAMSVKREGLFKTLQKQLLFPVMLDELVVDILSDKEVKNWETWKNVPWAGRPWYWWIGGGHLKTLKEEKKARNERRNQRRRRRDD